MVLAIFLAETARHSQADHTASVRVRKMKVLASGIIIYLLARGLAAAPTFVPLGDLPDGGFDSNANAVSADGGVIVGSGVNPQGFTEAFAVTGLNRQPNDDFADRTVLSGNTTTSGSNIDATGEGGEPSHAGVSIPLSSVWWSWSSPVSGQLTVSTLGSNFDTTLAAYVGSTVESLTEIASNDDFQRLTSRVTFSVIAGTPYAIAVDGYGSSEGTISLALTFGPAPDLDSDGVPNMSDNCKLVANATQCDSDNDGYGNRCDGDFGNPAPGNGSTNSQDFLIFRGQIGQPSVAPTYNKADINCSGAVNAQDFVLFRGLLGYPPGPSGLACAGTVPCPPP